jgi:hypothetical protein
MQKQHAADSTTLGTAMGEVDLLRVQLAAAACTDCRRRWPVATIDDLWVNLNASEEAEAQACAMHEECKQQLEASRPGHD